MQCVGFSPIAAADARVLILGTLPSIASLQRAQYYAHPQNGFWWIMGNLVGAAPDLPYEERKQRLSAAGIALWDVCHAAHRIGSSDAKIERSTLVPNDLAAFFATHARIQLICFNGQAAEKLFRATVPPLPKLIPTCTLESTSPANARIRREEKLVCWRTALEPYLGRSTPIS
jgi:hypoxanthine-DNA glycosylase